MPKSTDSALLLSQNPRASLVPVSVQIGIVVVLFAGSIASLLWMVGSVMSRERAALRSREGLEASSLELAGEGGEILAQLIPVKSKGLGAGELEKIDGRLAEIARKVLSKYPGVEGGYFSDRARRFVGAAFPVETEEMKLRNEEVRVLKPGPPPNEFDLIEIRVDASIRRARRLFAIEDAPPSTVAVCTTPIRYNDEIVGAAWAMTRVVDPAFLAGSTRGYLLASCLALGGIALALLLTLGLARTVRRHSVERRQLQNALRRSKRLVALGKLLAGVAHEVRNPLAGIRSTVQLWQRGIGRDQESEDGLIAEVDRLETIVSELLHFSRTDSQTMVAANVNEIVAESAKLAQIAAEAQKVRIEVSLHPNPPPVSCSPQAIIQIFRNLITNALQVSPSGGVVRLSTSVEPGKRWVEVSVQDDGPGLSPEVREHVFEPFFTTKAEGTGLGLAIAREIALAHHGDLRAANRRDSKGALFTLLLPLDHNKNDRTSGAAG